MVCWNKRMCELTGESKYIDVLERSLYNGALDGLSLSGDRFFYGNPLASNGRHSRREWFGTACCPANIARLVASLGDYIYGASDQGLWVNLFVASNTSIKIGKTDVPVSLETNYPWEGNVKLSVQPKTKTKFAVHMRIPGWAQGQAIPGDLYVFEDKNPSPFIISINGKPVDYKMEKGYAVIEREWKKGDQVELNIPMEVKRVMARAEVKQDKERIALQSGPLRYLLEGADNNWKAL